MYQVSEEYIEALKKPAKLRRLKGKIGSLNFTQENIISGSFIIDNKCSEDDQVKIGSVYIGQLTAVFTGIDLTGEWYKKKITASEGLQLEDESWEDIPLGVWHVAEAIRGDDGIHVTAYDNMTKFDKKFRLSTYKGYPYDFLYLICDKCNVQLAQTEEEIKSLPNGTLGMVLYPENDIDTYRDLLGWVAQALGCFATIDRQGKLVLRKYKFDVDDVIETTDRYRGSTYADFFTYYTEISLTKIKTGEVISDFEGYDGLTYELGANPLLQKVSEGNTGPLLNILGGLSAIAYTPFKVYRSGCPAYDLGDVVEFPGGNGNDAIGCIMSYQYNYHVEYVIEGFGSNPELNGVKSKEEKQISGLMKSNAVGNQIQYYPYTNVSPYTIHDEYTEIIYFRFGSVEDTVVTFHAEIKLNATAAEEAETVIGNIKYILNNNEVSYTPKETWIEGTHLLHLMYYINVEADKLNILSVRMNTDGQIDINRLDIQACVYGQGLAKADKWDGYILCEDEITPVSFGTTPATVVGFSEQLTAETDIPLGDEYEESIYPVSFGTTPETVIGFEEELYVNKHRLRDYTWGQVRNQVFPAWDEYRENLAYARYDLVYVMDGNNRTEYRCICADGETTTGPFDPTKWEVRTYNTWGDIYYLCAW